MSGFQPEADQWAAVKTQAQALALVQSVADAKFEVIRTLGVNIYIEDTGEIVERLRVLAAGYFADKPPHSLVVIHYGGQTALSRWRGAQE